MTIRSPKVVPAQWETADSRGSKISKPGPLPETLRNALFSALTLGISFLPVASLADTPLGWINAAIESAYTTSKGELEISLQGIGVNDTLDVFNYRDDIISASGRLEGDSGDLQGGILELHYGLTESISLFYRRQDHKLTLDLGEINSVDLIDIDNGLETIAEEAGFKWTFYRANLLNPDNRQSAASIEVTGFTSSSDDFNTVIQEIRLDNFAVIFPRPQTFSISDLEDEGWKSRLLYSWPLQSSTTATAWLGYGQSSATSGTDSDIGSFTISRFFEQSFSLEEDYLLAGASFSAQLSPRAALNVNYEYVHIANSTFKRLPETPVTGLPSFLSAGAQSDIDNNHVLSAHLSYWLTPALNVKISGNFYANQFIGILPHYNNPLSGSFSSAPYGFAGLGLMYKIRVPR